MRSRVVAVSIAVTVLGAALIAPDSTERADAAVTSKPAVASVAVAQHGSAWRPSSNARISTIRRTSPAVLQVKPRKAAGRKTISMRSPTSATAIRSSGATVRVSARVRTSQPGRRITLRVVEVNAGRVVSSRSTTVKPASTGWRRLAVSLRTTRPGSHVQVHAQAKRVTGRHLVRLTSLQVTAAGAPVGVGGGTTQPPVDTTPCQDVDYSDPDQGVLTFSEDFDGTSLDRSRWRVRDDTFLNQDQAWITKDAVSVHDGYLDIAGKRLPQSQWKTNSKALYPAENTVRDYSTGYIDSIDDAGYGNAAGNRFGQKYGSFEIRALVPSQSTMSRGIWPAFWLRADHQAGEIDPMESYGGPTIRTYDPSSSYEWNSWADTAQGSTSEANKQKTQGRANVGTDKIWQEWHTYGVVWSPNCLRYTYDGKTAGVVDFNAPGTMKYFRGPTFDDTFHIRLNMQIGSKYWGWADPQHTRDSFSFKVDWVRVHQGKALLGR